MADTEVTADNLTDEQIRAINTVLGQEMARLPRIRRGAYVTSSDFAALDDLRRCCAVALGISRSPRIGHKAECKRRIADAINARAKAVR